ncbi:ankyrin repeat domain-containing protein [Legionella brunensis]|uniref:Ankyrin repeat protein n=1 Tax=Legionella brunensis TaxID=29422 RepID=A0A0W0S5U5_9GAMM|nr:ankyrin repeat domain-containing protein [Legionella brunensis]KTC78293.1 Ankyrin repeat protein [Legionella brunensis]
MKHYQLINFAHALGYQKYITEGGLCYGFSAMWAQAVCSGQLEAFNERLKFLEGFANNPKELKKQIDEVKDYVKTHGSKNLSKQQKMLLDVPAFFEGVAGYLRPDVAAETFGKSLQQQHMLEVSGFLQSKSLAERGGFSRAFQATDQYSQDKLTAHLSAISQQLKRKADTAIHFSANGHAVGVRVVGDDKFQIIDTNQLEDYGKTFTSKELAKKLNDESFFNKSPWHGWLTGKQPLVLTTSIYTNQSMSFRLDSLKEKAPITSLAQDKNGQTVIHRVAIENDLDTLKRLDFSKIDVNQRGDKGNTALDFACLNASEEVIDYLLDDPLASATLDVTKSIGHPITMAAAKSYFHIVDKLLDHPRLGATMRAAYDGSLFKLVVASEGESEAAISYFHKLAEQGEDINRVDQFNFSPLYHACISGKEKMVALLLEHDADVNTGVSPLIGAACSDKDNLVNTLLEKGIDCNKVDNFNRTALHLACFMGKGEMVDSLLKHGADCNLKSDHGMTPLMSACMNGHAHLIPKLLPHTKLSMEDIKENSSLFNLINKCDIDVQTEFLKKALQTYINNRSDEGKHHNRFSLGFSQDEKIDAAKALLKKLNGEEVYLRDHHGALNNGRLFDLYDLYTRLEDKKQVFSPTSMLSKLGGPSPSSTKTPEEVKSKATEKTTEIVKNDVGNDDVLQSDRGTYQSPTPFNTTFDG